MSKCRIFYQHPYKNHRLIFSGQLPGVALPNMHLMIISNYYRIFSSFHFELILCNNIRLSILRENGRSQVQVAQIIDEVMTMTPIFDHDGFGEHTMYLPELGPFIRSLVEDSVDRIWGLTDANFD